MMIPPTKEQMRMHQILDPWLMFDGTKFVLKHNAPKEAVDMYEIYKQKYMKHFK